VDSYKSIEKETRIEYVIEKSKFIATACPCTTEEDAANFIARINKEFWDATHNCTAYALGPNQEQQRSSDNGEPSGTAGKPILEVLKKTGITNTAIVVTRYFGGIKLGAAGLIRAYSHSAAEVIKAAPKLLHAPRQLVEVIIDYGYYGTLERFLNANNIYYKKDFQETVILTLYVDPKDTIQLESDITNLTTGQCHWKLKEIQLIALHE